MRRRVAVLAIAAFALGACGGSAGSPGAAGTRTPNETASWPSPYTASPRPSASSPAPKTTTPAPKATTPAPVGTSTPAPLGTSAAGHVTLGRSCVHRGVASEQQMLTVAASPGTTVGYSTYYSDYSSELNRPDYKTGFGYGQAGSDGMFRSSWVVPATATPGRATVQVITGSEDPETASFIVAEQGAACPA